MVVGHYLLVFEAHTEQGDTSVQMAGCLLLQVLSCSVAYESMSGYQSRGNGWSVRVVSGLVIAVSGVCYFIKLSY